METLTKENFWNEMEQKYPKAMKHFKEWVDNYKEVHYWHILFNSGMLVRDYSITEGSNTYTSKSPKYHELPIAMQVGIFSQFISEYQGNGPENMRYQAVVGIEEDLQEMEGDGKL